MHEELHFVRIHLQCCVWIGKMLHWWSDRSCEVDFPLSGQFIVILWVSAHAQLHLYSAGDLLDLYLTILQAPDPRNDVPFRWAFQSSMCVWSSAYFYYCLQAVYWIETFLCAGASANCDETKFVRHFCDFSFCYFISTWWNEVLFLVPNSQSINENRMYLLNKIYVEIIRRHLWSWTWKIDRKLFNVGSWNILWFCIPLNYFVCFNGLLLVYCSPRVCKCI